MQFLKCYNFEMENMLNTVVKGENNNIFLIKDGIRIPYSTLEGLYIDIKGNNNTVEIELPSNFKSTHITIAGDNNFISIAKTGHRYIRKTTFGLSNGGKITVGSGLSVYRDLNVVAKNTKSVHIGNECMIAREVVIRNDDAHVMFDKNTGELINPPDDIYIGNNVWIAMRSLILKGAKISDGSVVGAMSLVNKKFEEENIVLAGVPARKIRGNVSWKRMDYNDYLNLNPDIQ